MTSDNPVHAKDLRLIGSGATADVYRLSDDTIVKLFKESYGEEAARYEAGIADAVSKTAIKAPRYRGMLTIDGRIGVAYDFVPGDLLFARLLAEKPRGGIALIKKLAREHAAMHDARFDATPSDAQRTARCSGLPSEKDRLSYLIRNAEGIDRYRPSILGWLAAREAGKSVCHGDLHCGNLIVEGNDFIAIDWMNAYAGDRAGDALRSYLMLASPFIPMPLSFPKRLAFLAYKRVLAEAYLSEYRKRSGLRRKDIRAWWPAIAAARLADRVPGESAWLLRKIKGNLWRMKGRAR
ncbi:MAG TPA: aminoglycoside phosphotransferase family protein [Treponemataceae bacterium]|nr:aminoglycoside phosphotransferase family protein [Treponemataceae bacterium]